MDSRVIYFNQFDGDVFFGLTFYIGHNKLDLQQYSEDKYNLFIDGNRFYDLMTQEKIERQSFIKQKQREYQKMKKMEDDYYKRALKYNGKDYYEGKEKNLLNNNNYNNNNNNNKYNYGYYKKNENNHIYGYDNVRNNNYNNYNNNYQQNQNQIINQSDIKQIKQNINKNKNYNPYMEEEPKENNDLEINNPYPSFSQYQNTENNIGYNNRPNLKNYNTYDNTRNNNYNYNSKNNNFMNQLEEVFSNDNNINKKQPPKDSIKKNELPTYSEIYNNQNQNENKLSKKNSKDNNLINYIGNLNNSGNNNFQPTSIECAPTVNQKGYNFGFDENINDFKVDKNNNETELNIYNKKETENERNKKKMFMNKSSFKNPLKDEDYDMENPYNDY